MVLVQHHFAVALEFPKQLKSLIDFSGQELNNIRVERGKNILMGLVSIQSPNSKQFDTFANSGTFRKDTSQFESPWPAALEQKKGQWQLEDCWSLKREKSIKNGCTSLCHTVGLAVCIRKVGTSFEKRIAG